jgi:hypothetical protein
MPQNSRLYRTDHPMMRSPPKLGQLPMMVKLNLENNGKGNISNVILQCQLITEPYKNISRKLQKNIPHEHG